MTRQPKRICRSRRRGSALPPSTIYVGRPTIWGNPFGRPGIGHARGVILYRAWLAGELTPFILQRLRFGPHEIAALHRWRAQLLAGLPALAGRDLACWCPRSSPWCHADVLLARANPQAIAA